MKANYSAPGKVILFGEHAVVYGEPAIAVAVDKRTTCKVVQAEEETTVNGYPIDKDYHSYILEALRCVDIDSPLKIVTKSDVPSGAGMGSSAAVTVATLASLHHISGDLKEERLAREAFNVEWTVQGSASPIDTSTSTHGNAVMLSKDKEEDFLWSISREGKEWNIHHRDIPEMQMVIGDTGVHARTGPLVDKVRRFYMNNNFAKEIIEEIGNIVIEGSKALAGENLERVGELMDRNHELLTILGVSHPKLERLVKGARKYSYGAKLTGAGGGGSMVAVTDDPEKVARVIKRRGGTPYIIDTTGEGVSEN
ncbi:MAG: mevalonate kinase [Thermoplasmatota archaeon]